MLDDLDFFYKTDHGRKMIFYHQVSLIIIIIIIITETSAQRAL